MRVQKKRRVTTMTMSTRITLCTQREFSRGTEAVSSRCWCKLTLFANSNVHNRAAAQSSTFVPPYDEDDTSSEDEVSEEEEASSDEDAELLGRDRG
jgi:hypothetical protein